MPKPPRPMRSLSHNAETERALLGGLLLDPSQVRAVAESLRSTDFVRPAHQHLFVLVCELAARDGHLDLVTLTDELNLRGEMEQVGGITYILTLLGACASVSNVPQYAARVREHAERRRLELAGQRIVEAVQDGHTDIGTMLEGALKNLSTIARPDRGAAALPWVHPAGTWLTEEPPRRAYLLHDRDPTVVGDRGLGMLPRGKVGILAAAGGVGKTYALCGLALAVVTRRHWLGHFPVGECHGRAVLVLGEEDPAELRRRLHVQARAMDLGAPDAAAVAGILALPGAALDSLALTHPEEQGGVATPFAGALFEHLRRIAEDAGVGWDVVILDPLSRFAGPDVETDNAAATRLVQVLERFTQLPGNPAVLVAHHTTKTSRADGTPNEATAIRGSSALVDGARWAANMDSVPTVRGGPGHARIRVTKSNYAAFPKSVPSDGLLLTRVDGSGGLRVATREEEEALRTALAAAKDPERGGRRSLA